MSTLTATISIQDEPAPDLFLPLLELEVEDDYRLASAFRIKFAISREDDGLWKILDDERIRLWNKVRISVDLEGEQELITGYITHIKPRIESEENSSTLEIIGMDATCLMSLEEKIKDWPNKSDSDIAREILNNYNLDPVIDDTAIVHEETAATIIQRETDIQFLKRLARRNGFECFVKGGRGYFRKPVLTEQPQPVLAAHFGGETNLMKFDANVNALRPATVAMHQIDTIAKEIQETLIGESEDPLLGRDGGQAIAVPQESAEPITPRLLVKHAVATGQPEMEALGKALFNEASWFVEARGEVNTVCYGAVLEARKLVPVKGVGEQLSGLYYVTKVKHMFKPDQYTQQFEARRNALFPSGSEDFGGDGALAGGGA